MRENLSLLSLWGLFFADSCNAFCSHLPYQKIKYANQNIVEYLRKRWAAR